MSPVLRTFVESAAFDPCWIATLLLFSFVTVLVCHAEWRRHTAERKLEAALDDWNRSLRASASWRDRG